MQQKSMFKHLLQRPKASVPVSDQNYQKRIDPSGRHNRHSHKHHSRSAKTDEPSSSLREVTQMRG